VTAEKKIVATYDYIDESGTLLYQNCRLDRTENPDAPKSLPRRPDGNGGWIWDLKGTRRVLYRQSEFVQSSKQDWVFVCEGEPDTDRLNGLGLVATTSGSATSWRPEFAEFFRGRLVCILPDNDVAGKRYADTVADSLHGVASEVRIVELPGLPEKGDVSDWFDAGHQVPELNKLIEKAKPCKPVPDRQIQHQVLSLVEPKQIEYLQPEIIPLGMITSIVSQEGVGKSTLASSITAYVTQGKPWPNAPDVPNPKGHVIVFSHEEDVACVLVPRLTANGADRKRVIAGDSLIKTKGGDEQAFDIEDDIPGLEALVNDFPQTRLIVFDPITSYCQCNENSNSQVRQALKPLVDFAARRNIAVLALTHLNKKVALGMINRTIGSRAWSAVPRMVWGIRTEQIEDTDGQKTDTDSRFLLCIKCNVGPKPKGLRFSIGDGGRVIWHEERLNMSMDNDCQLKSSRIDKASEWLREYLGNKQMTSAAIFEDGEKAGFSRNLLYRAKDKLKIRPSKSGFGDAGLWFWGLPNDE